ncbi:hypothetical protein JI721_10480 [Alicyclobacillus cycloheptanicus]|uniref:Aconitase with swiveling domain n=1 Tax=Alicyclobacillus cycloheptanicus TaxID=1457 RepID=A0ABT9XFG5_9BACL|nr:hypothetical protein [Alicyclobacillus cycloheptanicus]MDQ0189036.1 putative aconitase with swiveling domain [Alicyclobacillus cycloheptanicus]WDM00173.1 hypothetical protein JI721_10480 [Alicyclobacillus cycloheptanicus]
MPWRPAPSAIVTSQLDPLLTLGALIGRKLYQRTVVMVSVPHDTFSQLRHVDGAEVLESGAIIRWSKNQ